MTTRRDVVTNVVLTAGATIAAPVLGAQPKPVGHPNVLWLVSEDNNPFIGAYGDRLARTPTIDSLAARGLTFRNAYSNAPVCALSRFGILTGVYPESCAPANQMRAVAALPKQFRTYPELMREAGYWCTNNAKTDYNCDVDPARIWDVQGNAAHWRSRPKDGRPFLSVFNYSTTHESQIFKPTLGRIAPAQVRVPPYLPDTPGIRGDYASYHNLIEKMDGQLRQRLAELEADGLAEDTIVFYYSDNGGVLPRSKRFCYDEGLRCALVVCVPPKWRHLAPAGPGSVIDAPVSFIDLAPTLLSIAGRAQPPQMAGRAFLGHRVAAPAGLVFGARNRMDEMIDFTRTVTDGRWRYIRNYMPHRPYGVHGAYEWQARGYQDWEREKIAGRLTATQARFFEPKAFEELYDLAIDPDQIDNLAARRPSERDRLSTALDAQMLKINDNGFIPEGMDGEGWIPSRTRGRYPLKDLIRIGRLAGERLATSLPALRSALTSPNPIVRFWGATGLVMQGADAEPFSDVLASAAAGDPSMHVRVAAAEALANAGSTDGVSILATMSAPSQSWQIRLLAMNALIALGERARPALPAIEAAAREETVTYIRSTGRYLSAVLNGNYAPDFPVFEADRAGGNG